MQLANNSTNNCLTFTYNVYLNIYYNIRNHKKIMKLKNIKRKMCITLNR